MVEITFVPRTIPKQSSPNLMSTVNEVIIIAHPWLVSKILRVHLVAISRPEFSNVVHLHVFFACFERLIAIHFIFPTILRFYFLIVQDFPVKNISSTFLFIPSPRTLSSNITRILHHDLVRR